MAAIPRSVPEAVTRDEAVAAWVAIPGRLRRVVRDLPEARLDVRADPRTLTARETVHHLTEANLIASNIVIAALAKSGMTYDWTWVTPGGPWMQRLGYDRAPIAPALATLAALTRHLAALLAATPDGLDRTVQLYDAPAAPHYTKSVRDILRDEARHAREHLDALPPRAPTGKPSGRRPRSGGRR